MCHECYDTFSNEINMVGIANQEVSLRPTPNDIMMVIWYSKLIDVTKT